MGKINFQGQFDSHFWFSETAGEVSRQLNKIVNLEVVDKTMANIASELRKTKTKTEIYKEEMEKAEIRKKELLFVKDMHTELNEIESLDRKRSQKATESTTIAELVNSVQSYREAHKNGLELTCNGKKVMIMWDKYANLGESYENLLNLTIQAGNYQKQIKARPPSIKPLQKLKDSWKTSKYEYDHLVGFLNTIKTYKTDLCLAEDNLKELQKEFKKVMGKVCPLCKRKM